MKHLALIALTLALTGLAVAHESTKCSHVNCKVANLPNGQVLHVFHHNKENKCSGDAGEQHQCAITQEKECECHVLGTHPWSHYRQQHPGSVVKAVALVSGMRLSSFSETVSDGVQAALTMKLGVLPEQVQIMRARATPEDDGVLFDVCVSVKDTEAADVALDEMEAIKTTENKAASFNSLLHQEIMSALVSKGQSTYFLTDEEAPVVLHFGKINRFASFLAATFDSMDTSGDKFLTFSEVSNFDKKRTAAEVKRWIDARDQSGLGMVSYRDFVKYNNKYRAPTPRPTPAPTAAPTTAPTAAPTSTPTTAPTSAPTVAPTAAPTAAPTVSPTAAPTAVPTVAPTSTPTTAPTSAPTVAPTAAPTAAPTVSPTAAPTAAPTKCALSEFATLPRGQKGSQCKPCPGNEGNSNGLGCGHHSRTRCANDDGTHTGHSWCAYV